MCSGFFVKQPARQEVKKMQHKKDKRKTFSKQRDNVISRTADQQILRRAIVVSSMH